MASTITKCKKSEHRLTRQCENRTYLVMVYSAPKNWLEPACRVVAKFATQQRSGAQNLADILGIDPSRVYRWMYAKEDGGSGGHIPADHHRPILQLARDLGISLTPAELTGLTEFETSPPTRKLSRKSVRCATGDRHPQLQLAAQ